VPTFFPRSLLLMLAATPCLASNLGTLVPAYFYPGTGGPGGAGDGWAALAAAAARIPVTAIFNPDSGPLPGPADPNYVAAMNNLESAGGKVIAYIFTDDGNTLLANVESQVSTYLTQYGSRIDGFFLDGMLVTPSTLAYYQSIDSYIQGLNPDYLVAGNPGQPFLNGLSPANYLTAAGLFNLFEGPNLAPSPGAAGFDQYPYGLNWFQSFPSSSFSNIIYNAPLSALLPDIAKAVSLNAGDVYITDQTLPNPYAQLPSY
jgi:hypothetical protein